MAESTEPDPYDVNIVLFVLQDFVKVYASAYEWNVLDVYQIFAFQFRARVQSFEISLLVRKSSDLDQKGLF